MQATAVDTDRDLARSLVGFVKYLLHTHGRPFFDAIAELDLSLTQVRTLRILSVDRDEISLKELAAVLGLSLPAVSRSVEVLVQRGLLTRTEDSEDRRLKRLRATGEARDLVDRLLELRFGGLEDFVASLSPRERSRLSAALEPIVARDDVARVCGPGSER